MGFNSDEFKGLNKKCKCYSSQCSCCFPNELRFLEGSQVPPLCPSSKSILKNESDFLLSQCRFANYNTTLTWYRTWTSSMTEKRSCLTHGTAFDKKINPNCISGSIRYRAVNTASVIKINKLKLCTEIIAVFFLRSTQNTQIYCVGRT